MDEISGHIALFLSVDCFSTKEKIRIKIVFKMVSLEKIKIAEPHILKKKLQKKIPQPPSPPPPREIMVHSQGFFCFSSILQISYPRGIIRHINDVLKEFFTLRACLHGGGGSQIGEVTCGGSPHLSYKRDQIKMRDYMDRRVTTPKRVTSPTWGPPPACKKALNA